MSEEMRHTSGPWQLDYTIMHGRIFGLCGIMTESPENLLTIEGSGGARSLTQTICSLPGTSADEANARLIAAAPDLLEALKDYVRPYVALSNDQIDANMSVRKAQCIKNARVAIAKATQP